MHKIQSIWTILELKVQTLKESIDCNLSNFNIFTHTFVGVQVHEFFMPLQEQWFNKILNTTPFLRFKHWPNHDKDTPCISSSSSLRTACFVQHRLYGQWRKLPMGVICTTLDSNQPHIINTARQNWMYQCTIPNNIICTPLDSNTSLISSTLPDKIECAQQSSVIWAM